MLISLTYGVGLYGVLLDVDHTIYSFVLKIQHQDLGRVMVFFTFLGNWQILLTLEVGVLVAFFAAGRRRDALITLLALISAEIATLVFKMFSARARPEGGYLVVRGLTSFPSGHALISLVFYGLLAYLVGHFFKSRLARLALGLGAAAIIFLVGLSRVYLGAHWFSDVLGGWFLGGLILTGFIALSKHI